MKGIGRTAVTPSAGHGHRWPMVITFTIPSRVPFNGKQDSKEPILRALNRLTADQPVHGPKSQLHWRIFNDLPRLWFFGVSEKVP
jgi:hypothetical protein